jgi:NADPH:quinone reductase-like Zn-dependent oxidoreductase
MTGGTVGFAVDAFGERGSLRPLRLPDLGPRDVRVRLEAAGVNPIDFKLRDGLDPSRPLPLVLGQDFAGTVEAAGAGAADLAGKRVFGVSGAGAWARELVVSADGIVAEIPAGIEATAAAALPIPGLTALALVERIAHRGARSVVVIGPDGAVGRLVLQIAAAHGIKTLGLRSSDDPAALLASAALERADAAIDTAGDKASLEALAPFLRASGYAVSIVFVADVQWFAARGIEAENLNTGTTPFYSGDGLRALAGLVARKQVAPHVDAVRPFAEALDVLDAVKARALRGKVVLAV